MEVCDCLTIDLSLHDYMNNIFASIREYEYSACTFLACYMSCYSTIVENETWSNVISAWM
jgi:hypothetical protein